MKSYTSPFGPVYLEESFDQLQSRLKDLSYSTAFIIADSNTATQCIPLLDNIISNYNMKVITHGEQNKTMHQCGITWSYLIEHGADRKSIILNVGGGMICDFGGFVASCFQRGIRFIHIPTSLLAMTDAAIGGKTGVDFMGYKNYIGVFSKPEFVWINTDFLKTLPKEEIKNGLTEMVKHAIIGSAALWNTLDKIQHIESIEWNALLELSIPVKLNIIQQDPYETGMRKSLNFGHTIGHALESYFLSTDTPLHHGQAVAWGMLAESKMALDENQLSTSDFEKINTLIFRLLEPPQVELPSIGELLPWMMRDKKNISQDLSFSLPLGIGACQWGLGGL
ncbi:MAG TPA: 3-dehydroquinate synthase, partial [Saprospiraceae bacterium]|nr:3-dehydroquinate synthase [Saprospiraceae bacterium]